MQQQDMTSTDLLERLNTMEQQLTNTVSREQCQAISKAQVQEGFRQFAKVMEKFAMEISALTSKLADETKQAYDAAAVLEKEAKSVTDAELEAFKTPYAGLGFTSTQLQAIVDQAIFKRALEKQERATVHRLYAQSKKETAKALTKGYTEVEKNVKLLAESAHCTFSTPTIIKHRSLLTAEEATDLTGSSLEEVEVDEASTSKSLSKFFP